MEKNILLGICGGISSYKSCELIRFLIKDGFSVKVVMTPAAREFVSPLVFGNLSKNPVYLDMFTPLEKATVGPVRDKSLNEGRRRSSLTGFTPLDREHLTGIILSGEDVRHVSLAQWAALCVIAPLTANTLAKIAGGICDNLLTTIVCALPKSTKVLLVPAMNEWMWKNPILQDNLDKLKKIKKYITLNPLKGELACGCVGCGRMIEPEDIFKNIKSIFKKVCSDL